MLENWFQRLCSTLALFLQVMQPLQEIAFQMSLEYGFVWRQKENQNHIAISGPPDALWVEALVESNERSSRDWLERYLSDELTTANLHFNLSNNHIQYQSRAFPARLPKPSEICLRSDINCYRSDYSIVFLPETFEEVDHFIEATELMNCPYINFNKTMYDIFYSEESRSLFPDTIITLKIGAATLNFSKHSELYHTELSKDESLKVCRNLLDLKLKELEEEQRREFYSKIFVSKADEATTAQYYLTLACVSISMVCLILTLATYSRFRALRSAAGVNNIFLCASLLLAQASLFASAHM